MMTVSVGTLLCGGKIWHSRERVRKTTKLFPGSPQAAGTSQEWCSHSQMCIWTPDSNVGAQSKERDLSLEDSALESLNTTSKSCLIYFFFGHIQ